MRTTTKLLLPFLSVVLATAARAAAPRVQLHPTAESWTAFSEGDELVAVGGGQADWLRNGRVISPA